MAVKKRYLKTHVKAVETGNGTLETKLTAIDNAVASKASLANPVLSGVPTAPTPGGGTNNTQIATTAFVQAEINAKIAVADAMIYKGTLGAGGTVATLPATHSTGWTYKVITAGTYAAQKCEVGDMVICLTDGTMANDGHWTVVQSNIDGAVTGPSAAVAERIATFNGTTGKIVKDGGLTLAQLVQTSRNVIAGNGLSGGGTLGADITLNVGAGTGITVQADTVSHQAKPTTGTDAGGSGAVVTSVTTDAMGHVVFTTKGNITAVTGNAGTATKLQTPRALTVSAPGIVGTSAVFDGSSNLTLKFNDSVCLDLSGAATDNAELKTAFGSDGYYRPYTNNSLVVNTKITGPGFHNFFNQLKAVNGKLWIYIGANQFIGCVAIDTTVDGIFGCDFKMLGINYMMRFKEVFATDGGTVEIVIIRDSGLTNEIPTMPSTTGSWAVPELFIASGYKFHDVTSHLDYEYDGKDWLYEEYVTA